MSAGSGIETLRLLVCKHARRQQEPPLQQAARAGWCHRCVPALAVSPAHKAAAAPAPRHARRRRLLPFPLLSGGSGACAPSSSTRAYSTCASGGTAEQSTAASPAQGSWPLTSHSHPTYPLRTTHPPPHLHERRERVVLPRIPPQQRRRLRQHLCRSRAVLPLLQHRPGQVTVVAVPRPQVPASGTSRAGAGQQD